MPYDQKRYQHDPQNINPFIKQHPSSQSIRLVSTLKAFDLYMIILNVAKTFKASISTLYPLLCRLDRCLLVQVMKLNFSISNIFYYLQIHRLSTYSVKLGGEYRNDCGGDIAKRLRISCKLMGCSNLIGCERRRANPTEASLKYESKKSRSTHASEEKVFQISFTLATISSSIIANPIMCFKGLDA